jgi:metal-dependent amidase/aminoacylase/carboxypeptidase family protein
MLERTWETQNQLVRWRWDIYMFPELVFQETCTDAVLVTTIRAARWGLIRKH